MGLLSTVLVTALAQVVPSPPAEPKQIYLCEVSRDAPAGKHEAGMFVGEAGQSFGAWGRWEQAAPNGAGGFNIRWALDPRVPVDSVTVEVNVPIRKWKMGRASLGLNRPDDDGVGNMRLMGPVLHGTAGGGRGVAQASLRTLLAFATDSDRLHWYVVSDGSRKVEAFGDIDMAPLREAVAALPSVRAELAAKQARYRSECRIHVEEPQI